MLPDFRVRQRDYLLEIARAISQELEIDKLLERILKISAEMLAGQAGLISLRAGDGGWKIAASTGIPPALLRYLDPLLAEIPDHEDPARFELPELNRLLQRVARNASLGLLSGVGLPLIARKKVIGVIFVFRGYSGGFSREDLNLLQSFADQAAIAVYNAQLYTQVRKETQRLGTLLDSIADGILIFSPDHKVERASPAFGSMYGQPIEKIVDAHHDEIIQLDQITNGMTLEDAEAGGWPLTPTATFYVEGDLKRPGQTGLPVGITYSPLVAQDNSLLNIIATVRDISHFREAEELKSTFISVVSHELRTPVALIKGYVSTLRREDATWDRAVLDDGLMVIEEETDRLSEMIENLLDASRFQAGGISLKLADLSLAELAKQQAERFQTQSDRHKIRVDFPEKFPIVLGDQDRLTQVLDNLISNAIKYSPDGGEITIQGQLQQRHVIVCVADPGIGIAPGDMPHVFDRFYRTSEATRKTKGAGLGLYLTRAIIEAHGGRIWIDPKRKAGTEICFSLPRPES
ncbi:MAG: ATP-binding protein [Anaerolineales bacterium]|nr:ATP-binding protein [Anaerolineales bacterium]